MGSLEGEDVDKDNEVGPELLQRQHQHQLDPGFAQLLYTFSHEYVHMYK